MRKIHRVIAVAAAAAAFAAIAACQTEKSSNPLTPTIAGPIPGVVISPPALLSPPQGTKLKESDQPVRLVVGNATTSGVRPLTYMFEVASDNGFASKVFSRSNVPPGENGQTSVQLDPMEIGRSYYWRVRAEDGANTGNFATSAFEIFPKAVLNPPAPVAPVNNAISGTTSPGITVLDSDRAGPIGNLQYEFQVALDQAFTQVVAHGIVAETPGQTTYTAPALTANKTHFWRVRASDGETTSAWATTQVFKTPAAPAPPPPSPVPNPGAPCVASSALAIVQCERNKYGHMSPSQTVDFEKAVARSLNSNKIPDGPFGILRKSGGNNCNGYSCDIICSGQGTSQKQWDILGDSDGAQVPGWNGPATYPNIRMDVCEIQ